MGANGIESERSPTRDRWVHRARAFALLTVVWTALDGTATWPAGLAVATVGAWIAGALALHPPAPIRPLRAIGFAAYFVAASVVGGIDVAWRAFRPGRTVQPSVRRLPLRLPAGTPLTLMVSALSLMPGTLAAGLEDDGRTLVVHALTDRAHDGAVVLHDRVRWAFALDARSDARSDAT